MVHALNPIFGKYFATTAAPDKTSGPSVHGGHALLESLQSLKCFSKASATIMLAAYSRWNI